MDNLRSIVQKIGATQDWYEREALLEKWAKDILLLAADSAELESVHHPDYQGYGEPQWVEVVDKLSITQLIYKLQ